MAPKFLSRLCCSPIPKRKPSIKLADPSAIEIPAVTPPAPPPSRALHYGEVGEETESEEAESAAEINQRLRSAGHTPGLHDLPKSKAANAKTSASTSSPPLIEESDSELLQAKIPIQKTWSTIASAGSKSKVHEANKYSLGGDEDLMTKPSQRRYSEDVAERNLRIYGGSDTPSPPASTGALSMSKGVDVYKSTSSDLPQSASEGKAASDTTALTTNDSVNEYEGQILAAPDLGQYAPAVYRNQPSSWKTPDSRPFADHPRSSSDPQIPVVRVESFAAFLRTTSPTDAMFKGKESPKSIERGERRQEMMNLPKINEPSSDEEDTEQQNRKVSNTPSMGVSRYSTAKAEIHTDRDGDDTDDTDRAVKWKGFGN